MSIPRLRDTVEELRHSLQPKESALEALQQSLLEKDQVSYLEFFLMLCGYSLITREL